LLVLFGSDSALGGAESHSSGIRFVPGDFIRFHSGFHSSKVMAKLQNSRLFSCVTGAMRIRNPRVVSILFLSKTGFT
jgi:hypothetical protein